MRQQIANGGSRQMANKLTLRQNIQQQTIEQNTNRYCNKYPMSPEYARIAEPVNGIGERTAAAATRAHNNNNRKNMKYERE